MHRFSIISASDRPRLSAVYCRLAGAFLLLLVALLPAPLLAEAPAPDTEQLVRIARERKLSETPYWRTLLHCPVGLTPYRSFVDDPAFFLAETGKTDADAELSALIRTFFGEAPSEVPLCRFIARYTWVYEQLADVIDAPPLICDEAERLHPSSATLIFPTYHLNNPASMFGHTFLTIETDYQAPMLADAVNYAALPDSRNPITYMFKGIVGSFKGYYAILPYYKKIQEYGDMAQRDIWEYPLTLTPEETRRMVLHILELKESYSYYYFFDKNCSYMLQFLLEVARPGLSLTHEKGLTVIPIDTIKAMQKAGLITEARYRPSIGSRIQAGLGRLDKNEVGIARDLSDGTLTPGELLAMDLTDRTKRLTLDLVTDVNRYRRAKKKLSQDEFKPLFLGTLKARKTLGKGAPDEKAITAPPEPTTGHDAARISATVGVYDGDSFEELTITPAFTNLLNTDYTKREGIQIEFLRAQARFDNEESELDLQALTILDIISLSPRNPFIRPLSWTFHAGYEKRMTDTGDMKGAYSLRAATGMAWNLTDESLFFLLPEAELLASKGLDKGASVGPGLRTGILFSPADRWRMLLSGNITRRMPDDSTESRVAFETNLTVNRNNRMGLSVSRTDVESNGAWETSLSWHRYF
ncbi:protein of unknown function [Desulfoluna spongiiphila]|uniref:Uncharacterized protein n=1 Tax=Desulfoluna spongiiphila TaxID=419481 RepID=A0A1G5CZM5_9BACT|nr:protein of unknown function [Desulfoluna spongiiphila]